MRGIELSVVVVVVVVVIYFFNTIKAIENITVAVVVAAVADPMESFYAKIKEIDNFLDLITIDDDFDHSNTADLRTLVDVGTKVNEFIRFTNRLPNDVRTDVRVAKITYDTLQRLLDYENIFQFSAMCASEQLVQYEPTGREEAVRDRLICYYLKRRMSENLTRRLHGFSMLYDVIARVDATYGALPDDVDVFSAAADDPVLMGNLIATIRSITTYYLTLFHSDIVNDNESIRSAVRRVFFINYMDLAALHPIAGRFTTFVEECMRETFVHQETMNEYAKFTHTIDLLKVEFEKLQHRYIMTTVQLPMPTYILNTNARRLEQNAICSALTLLRNNIRYMTLFTREARVFSNVSLQKKINNELLKPISQLSKQLRCENEPTATIM